MPKLVRVDGKFVRVPDDAKLEGTKMPQKVGPVTDPVQNFLLNIADTIAETPALRAGLGEIESVFRKAGTGTKLSVQDIGLLLSAGKGPKTKVAGKLFDEDVIEKAPTIAAMLDTKTGKIIQSDKGHGPLLGDLGGDTGLGDEVFRLSAPTHGKALERNSRFIEGFVDRKLLESTGEQKFFDRAEAKSFFIDKTGVEPRGGFTQRTGLLDNREALDTVESIERNKPVELNFEALQREQIKLEREALPKIGVEEIPNIKDPGITRLTKTERSFFDEVLNSPADRLELKQEVPSFRMTDKGFHIEPQDITAFEQYIDDTARLERGLAPPGFRSMAITKRIKREPIK